MPAFNSGKKKVFPNVGAWAKDASGKLGLIFKLTTIRQVNENDPDDVIEIPSAIFHRVAANGHDFVESVTLPASELTKAKYDDLKGLSRPGQIGMFEHAQAGYELNSTDLRSLTALQRMQLGKSLDDSDLAQARIEESEEHLAALKRQRIMQDKRAVALEEEIETERLAFIASATARREAMAATIAKDLK